MERVIMNSEGHLQRERRVSYSLTSHKNSLTRMSQAGFSALYMH